MITEYKKEDEIRQHAIERLEEFKGSDLNCEDVHHALFNTDYYIVGTYRAAEWIKDFVFEAIEIVKEYELDVTGEVLTDYSVPEELVNMYVYIVGEHILHSSKVFTDKLDTKLTADDIDEIIKDLKK